MQKKLSNYCKIILPFSQPPCYTLLRKSLFSYRICMVEAGFRAKKEELALASDTKCFDAGYF